ncbi:hypothetical protein [Paraliomyxa miuraensis]|uniref:hypothetical protein n=1 Tax=Paraliomyxa miuraensis TaxID=376150 RepID=UPI00224FDCB0|nr:hypothetical protein [Paraliomyxa miuraensis]MCX4247875.1 hypothetical protein [Paraliomyxa miuraensis]
MTYHKTRPRRLVSTMSSSILALALAVGSGMPPALAAPGPTTSPFAPSSSPLHIAVESSVDDGELIKEWIEARNPDLAEKLRTSAAHEQWVSVTISGVTYDYAISVIPMRDGAPLEGAGGPLRCECNGERLLDLVDERIEWAVDKLRQTTLPSPPPPVVPTPSKRALEAANEPRPGSSDHARRPTRFQTMAIAVAAVGAGTLATGTALVLQRDGTRGEHPNGVGYTLQPPGIALIAVGAAALGAGVSLLIVEAIQGRKRAVAAAPTFGSRQAGISFVRHF